MRTLLRLLALTTSCVLAASLVSACGGGEDRSKAQLRLVSASPAYGALDLIVDDVRVQASVAYGATDRYVEVDPSQIATEVTLAGSSAALASSVPALSRGDRYTLVAYGGLGALRTVLLADNRSEPDSGKALLRVLNGLADADDLDIYLTTADVDVDLYDVEPLQAGAAVGAVGNFATVDAGNWRLRITAAGDREDLRLDLSGIALASRQIATLVVTSASGGVLVNALLVTQRGAIATLEGTQARVRAAAAVTDSGAVTATVNGVTLMNGTGAPAVGAYRLVPAGGSVQATVAVNLGQPFEVAPQQLVAGNDYTLLVWGPAGAGAEPDARPVPPSATASWIQDDNRLPGVAGRAKLRLVNGLTAMAAPAVPLALTVDFGPVAGNVAGGTASAPANLLATTSATLNVTAPGQIEPLFTDVDRTLDAGGVYSVFVTGSDARPTVFLLQDR